MPSKTGKTPASYYKSDVSVEQSTNVGFDSTTRSIISGDGAKSSMSASDDVFSVQPVNDNGNTMLVKNQGGSNILTVDSTNSKVLVNAGQVAANTNYAYFGITNEANSAWLANVHYAVPFFGVLGKINTLNVDFGTGTDPDDSFTTADTASQYASQIVAMIWRLPDNITISSVTHLEGAGAATGDTTRMHLKSFDFTSGATSCLTNGALLAHNSDIANAGNEQPYLSTWTVDSADVDANKAILCFFRSDSVNSDFSLTVTIKYFIR